MTPETAPYDAVVVDLAAHRTVAQQTAHEDDYEDDDILISPPDSAPPPPRQQERSKRRSFARKAAGLPVYSTLLKEAAEAKGAYLDAARDYQTALQRLEAERFDPAESVDELLAQVGFLSAGRFDLRPWLQAKGYITARQALLLLDLCASYGLAKPSPEVFPLVRRPAAQVDDPASLKRLNPYLSAQAKAALRRSR